MNLNSGCDVKGNFSIIIHGHNDDNDWIEPMIRQLLKHRHGCVIFIQYSSCIDNNNYFNTLKKWKSVSILLTSKLNEMESQGIPAANIFIYGFSLGGRIAIDASISFGKRKIGLIDGEES